MVSREVRTPHVCALLPMGLTSEIVAKEYGIPRARQDTYAAESYRKGEAPAQPTVRIPRPVPVRAQGARGAGRRCCACAAGFGAAAALPCPAQPSHKQTNTHKKNVYTKEISSRRCFRFKKKKPFLFHSLKDLCEVRYGLLTSRLDENAHR